MEHDIMTKTLELPEEEYCWDLEVLLENKTPANALSDLVELSQKLIAIKDSKYDSKQAFLQAKELEEHFTIKANKFFNYVSNKTSRNVIDNQVAALASQLDYEFSKFEASLGSEDVRILQNEAKISEWIKLPEFKPYRKNLQSVLDSKEHKLSNEIEDYLTKISFGKPSLEKIFSILDNSEIKYGYATTSSGKKLKITRENIQYLYRHRDKKVRKSARINFENAYLKHKNSLSALLFDEFKSHAAQAKVRKFPSTVEMHTFNDRVDDKFIQTLYREVKNSTRIFKKYYSHYKKFYKAKFNETMSKFDTLVDLVKVKNKYTIPEAQQIILKALSPMGEDYIKIIKKAFNENWIDYPIVDNKRSGAYSIGASYGLEKKYILMNFNGQLDSVETLAHELGHSMHSYYSDTNLSLEESQYPIFLAEIASIFNELMIFDYLLKHSDSDELKFHILNTIIIGFIGTVMRQVEWSNYEYDLYKAIENGKANSSYDYLSNLYFKNSQKYDFRNSNPEKRKYTEREQIGSIYVPHFYMNFYVYKYAIGQLVANVFFQRYQEQGPQALQNYIKDFLSAGGSQWPLEILKANNIDLYDPEVYQQGFKNIESIVNQWIKIGKKLFYNVK